MANFTTELRTICEHYGNNNKTGDYNDIEEIIEKARPFIFGNYEIFDDNYRRTLETKILKHFYTREIGYETVSLWKFKLNTKLEEIMPLYNQMYESTLLEFNPLYDVDLYTDHKGKKDTDGKLTSNSTDNRNDISSTDKSNSRTNDDKLNHKGTDTNEAIAELNRRADEANENREDNNSNSQTNNDSRTGDVNRDLYSDTPQGSLDGVEDGTYLTNARKQSKDSHTVDTGNTTDNSSSISNGKTNRVENSSQTNNETKTNEFEDSRLTKENGQENIHGEVNSKTDRNRNDVNNIKSTEQYLKHVYGHSSGRNYSQLLLDYRQTFLNIDMMIIDELEPLFMGIYF